MGNSHVKLAKMSDEGDDKTTAIVIGAGMRGYGYAHYQMIMPEEFQVIAVADPKEYQRNRLQMLCEIPDDMVFQDWRELIDRDRFADCVIICTQDQQHKEPAVAFAKKGYHILLEKPMATTEEDCREIVRVCQDNNVYLTVCHVLRYTPWVKKIRELIDSGAIGEVVNIQHLEPVGYWHFAHSFVRGNWHKESESSFSLLAKCCHDVDLICHWMGPRKCHSVSSFGHLSHFSQSNKVGYWHFAHSYVRGNWHKESESSPSLLAKCCHDVDLICHWMGDRKCRSVSSFGHLSHFNKENKPKNAASRCLDCPQNVESQCPYSAKKIYIEESPGIKTGNKGWPVSVLTSGPPDIESVTEALRTGPYGRCVYDLDNDVMSQQVVNMQFTGGATASLSMIGFTESVCAREVNVFGTKGEIRYKDGMTNVVQVDFNTGQRYFHELKAPPRGPLSGHGGADRCLMDNFEHALHHKDFSKIKTGAEETLASHLVVFAAEKARKENRVITINDDMSFT